MDLSIIDKLILSQLSSIEKQCIYKVVHAAMMIDGERNTSKIQLAIEIAGAIGLTKKELKASRRIDNHIVTQVIRNMDNVKKTYITRFVAHMILIDGEVSPREQDFFYSISTHLYLPPIN